MHTEKREDPLTHLGYETRDVNYGALNKAVIGFFLFTTVSAILGWIFFRVMRPSPTKADMAIKANNLPNDPFPRLQTNTTARVDLMELRQREDSLLNTGGKNADGSLHIPIDSAINLVVSRGIKPTGKSVPAVSKGNTTDERKMPEPGAPVQKKPATPAAGANKPKA